MKNIVITGPTCSGKTRAAVELAEKINGEIISADSRQIYRHIDIGTAKPSEEERRRIPHHLIDILEPEDRYTAADFRRDAERIMREIRERGARPVIAGGTGLYIRALVDGIFNGPPSDKNLRAKLEERAAVEGTESLYAELQKRDPAAAGKIHPNDKRRLIRAIEIYRLTGKPPSSVRRWESRGSEFIMFVLALPRDELYRGINERVKGMFREGFVEEVKRLSESSRAAELPAMEAVGCREILDYLKGDSSIEEAMEKTMAATRRYARRQLTWLRGDGRLHWLPVSAEPDWNEAASRMIEIIGRHDE
jgi:tRNA dimethylallyltransferase